MDIVNYPAAPENQIAAHQTADPPNAAGDRAKSCPLCGTLNHSLSRECFNCGWRGAFCGIEAARPGPFGLAPLLVKARSPRRSLRSRWEALKSWLFFIGSHRYDDTTRRNDTMTRQEPK